MTCGDKTKLATWDDSDDYCFWLGPKGAVSSSHDKRTFVDSQRWRLHLCRVKLCLACGRPRHGFSIVTLRFCHDLSHLPQSASPNNTSHDKLSQSHCSQDISSLVIIFPLAVWPPSYHCWASLVVTWRSVTTQWTQFHKFNLWRATRFHCQLLQLIFTPWYSYSWAAKSSSRRHPLQSTLHQGP